MAIVRTEYRPFCTVDNMKQIEPGCLCVVKGCVSATENLGKLVTAVRLVRFGAALPEIGNGEHVASCDPGMWLVQGESLKRKCIGESKFPMVGNFAICLEKHLMRIDGHEPEKTTEQQKEVSTC